MTDKRSTKQEGTEQRQDSSRCQNRTGSFYSSLQCWNRPRGTFTFTRGTSTGLLGKCGDSFRMGFETGDETRTCRKCGKRMESNGTGTFTEDK